VPPDCDQPKISPVIEPLSPVTVPVQEVEGLAVAGRHTTAVVVGVGAAGEIPGRESADWTPSLPAEGMAWPTTVVGELGIATKISRARNNRVPHTAAK